MTSHKDILSRYLVMARETIDWKLDGVSEYDLRRPLTPSGSNLIGILKHVASVELGYFGIVFGRPSEIETPWLTADSEPNADMWLPAEESPEMIRELARQAHAHADETIAALDLDSPGRVPWWGEFGNATLQLVMVHMLGEMHRHAGQIDVLRELVDGHRGYLPGATNLPSGDDQWWADYVTKLQSVAEGFR